MNCLWLLVLLCCCGHGNNGCGNDCGNDCGCQDDCCNRVRGREDDCHQHKVFMEKNCDGPVMPPPPPMPRPEPRNFSQFPGTSGCECED